MTPGAEPKITLTERQLDVLGVVVESRGPLTAADVGCYHMPIGAGSARSTLASLERKALVTAVYTGHGKRGRAYEATRLGEVALRQWTAW